MAKKYTMKDLGYERTPTTAIYRVTIAEGEVWDVPVQVIVDSRDENYADEKEDTIGFIRDGSLDKGEIADWASNNMNWDDVKDYATRVDVPRRIDFQDGWINGERKLVGTP